MTTPAKKLFQGIFALLLISILGVGTGCKSYQLGHSAELPFQSIYIEPVKNDSFAPQAQTLLSSEVREAVIRDGRVKLVAAPEQADAVLMTTLTDYRRQGGARRQNDTQIARDFDITLGAELDLYDQKAGKFIFKERRIEARTNVYLDNPYSPAGSPDTQGYIQSEYNAMPRLARELGRKAADELLGAW